MFKEECPLYSPEMNRAENIGDMKGKFTIMDEILGSDILNMGFAKLKCYGTDEYIKPFEVYPSDNILTAPTPKNKSSIVLLLEVDQGPAKIPYRYYTAGDLNGKNESKLVAKIKENPGQFTLTAMKVSHHGAKDSTPGDFLDCTKPQLAVISVGNNDYKHPDKNTLKRLISRDVLVLLTSPVEGMEQEGLLIVSVGDGIKHTVASGSFVTELRVDALGLTKGQITNSLYLKEVDPGMQKEKVPIVAGNSMLEQIVTELLPGNAYVMENDGTVCRMGECRLDEAIPCLLTDCLLTMGNDGKAVFTAQWDGISMTGEATRQGWTLNGAGGQGKMSLKELVALVTDVQDMNFFDYLPEGIWPQIAVDKVCMTRQTDDFQMVQVELEAGIGEDICLENEIRLKKPKMVCRGGMLERYGMKFWSVGMEVCLCMGKYELDGYVSFTNGQWCYVGVKTPNLVLTDVMALLPGNEMQKVKEWCEWLHLPVVGIEGGCVTVMMNRKISLQEVELDFSLTLFDGMKFEMKCTYRPMEKEVMLEGRCDTAVKLKTLLMDMGVKKEHLDFLPDLEMEYCVMNAVPEEKSFMLETDILIENGIEVHVASLTFSLEKLEMALTRNDTDTEVQLTLEGTLNGKTVNMDVTYDSQSGFMFEGMLEQINTADAIGSIIPVKGNLLEKFNLEMDDVAFSYRKGDIRFSTLLPSIELGKNVQLKQNEISIVLCGKELEFSIGTHLCIETEGQTVEVDGTLTVAKDFIYLAAISETPFADVLGIKGLDIGKVAVCLAENLTPPGMGIGLSGELAFGHLQGDIAIYLAPEIPDKALVAINFSGISLLDIVSVFVQCQDGGVAQTLESIGLEPVLLADAMAACSTDEATGMIDRYEGETGTFEVQTHDTYSWIPTTRTVLKNKTNFKTYELDVTDDGKYRLQKYVGMYACINPMDEGIELNGVTFRAGFAFDARLCFLSMGCNLDFSAEPKRGIKLYAEMEKAVTIGHWLTICRMENDALGPVLYLSLYPECFCFYFSARLSILSLIREEAKIMIGQNAFSVFLHSSVLGFSTTIEAEGELDLWNGKGWKFSLKYETNGLTAVTQEISDFLHKEADKVNQATQAAAQKLENAQRTVAEHERDVQNTQNQINEKQRELDNLKHTHYPWYKAYMYVALGVRIAAVGVEIGALAAYKVTLLGLLEAAKGVLKLAEAAVKTAGTLTADAMKAIGDVTAIVGKSIDWLIRLDEVAAMLDLEKNEMEFDFEAHYQLCGKEHQQSFSLHVGQSLKDTLIQIIKGGNVLTADGGENALDNLYGPMDEKERSELEATDWQLVKGNLETVAQQGERYGALLDELNRDLTAMDGMSNGEVPSVFTLDDARLVTSALDNCLVASGRMRNLTATVSREDLDVLDKAREVLQQESGVTTETRTLAELMEDSRTLADKADRMQRVSANGMEGLKGYLKMKCVAPEGGGTMEPKDAKSREIMMERYERIAKGDDTISAYTRSMVCSGLAEASGEKQDRENARWYAQRAVELTTDYFGKDSEEVTLMKDRMKNLL